MTSCPSRRRTHLPAALVLAGTVAAASSVHGDTLRVPQDFASIQRAIDESEPNDIILVSPGTYNENLALLSDIDIRGTETARTLLSPADDERPTVSITNASGVRFTSFTIIESTVGVAVGGSNGVDIANVVFDRATDTGLAVDGLSGVNATNNVFFENGIAIERGSNAVRVESNIFARNGDSIVTVLLPGADPLGNVRSNCFDAASRPDVDDDVLMGIGATVGDPAFVDPAGRDFHLREGSDCIDAGRGTDVIDGSIADAGAYGGPFADPTPFPVAAPTLTDVSTDQSLRIAVAWEPNLDYRVSNSTVPGAYRLYYERGTDPTPPLDGTDAGGGTQPSPIEVGNVTSFVLENLNAETNRPLAPRLLTATARNESVVLTWEAVPQATGYRVHYGVAAVTENAFDAGNATQATITGLANDTTYRFVVTALQQPIYQVAVTAVDNTQNRNESPITGVSSISLGEGSASMPSNELTATPAAIEPYPDLPDDGCFVATAAFGADWKAEVAVLRDFRDRILLPTAAGRALVRLYYRHGPRAAAFLEAHEEWKPLARAALWPFVALALVALGASPAHLAALAGLALLWAAARRRCRLLAVLLVLVAGGAHAADPPRFSPKWMYELKAGEYRPDLDDLETFYGSDTDTVVGVSGGFRVRDWLEVGGEVGRLRDDGIGISPGGNIEDAVKLKLYPVQVFATFMLQPHPGRRFVPYLGIGVAAVRYEQDIELQESREGRTDAGPAVRAGLRWLAVSEGAPRSAGASTETYWRGYAFLEAQRLDTDVDGIELGGTVYLLGFRVEFELNP
ncbi:MAG TPA: CFI-box-CTERM domain-containing protein [Gammaproteobacteria bacterium]